MLCALACIYIGNKWDDDNWWQSWAINSDSASTHHNSLDLKTIGQIVYDSSSFSQLVVNPARTATLGSSFFFMVYLFNIMDFYRTEIFL